MSNVLDERTLTKPGFAVQVFRYGQATCLTPTVVPFSHTEAEAWNRARMAFGQRADLRKRFAGGVVQVFRFDNQRRIHEHFDVMDWGERR